MTTAVRIWCSFEKTFDHDRQRRIRCPQCRKVVMTYPVYCFGGELIGFRSPPHKTKPKTYKRPKGDRRGARSRRG